MAFFVRGTFLLALVSLTVACSDGFRSPPGATGDAGETPDGGTVDPAAPDAGAGADSTTTSPTDSGAEPSGPLDPGSACNCDAQCAGTPTNPGVCVEGICMTRSSADCAAAGSSGECPAGSRCWGLEGAEGGICWPDCDAFTCDGACDGDGSCVFTESTSCNSSCSAICSSAGGGGAPVDVGTAPTGPPPSACRIGSMGIPDWRCTSGCTDLVPFSPPTGPGYDNYPINGESASNQYRSYIRRDVMMLVKYATAMVACQSAGWTFGNPDPLGLGDMSEADGSIPGTSIGSPGHPPGTHLDGADMDIAYYQVGTANNRLRPICDHMSGGADQYHCVSDPTVLEPWRTALFLGHLHANDNLRVIGVDGRAGVLIDAALTRLCSDGWVSGLACGRHRITYETTDTGRGWYYFHHHHVHISVSRP